MFRKMRSMPYPPGLYEATHPIAAAQAKTIGMAGFFDRRLTHSRSMNPWLSEAQGGNRDRPDV